MSRILNRQRQMAEQGRIRLGYTTEYTKKNGDPGTKPVRSETFILTSHSQEHIDAAAGLWGGEVEQWQPQGNGAQQWRVITNTKTLPAILPPGDPLTQAHELWTKGGCQRRCDGVTEQLTGSPCLCLADYGPDWHEQDPGDVCSTKSRLKVLLPDMPGLGSWRMETGSFYATDEIAGMVDFIRGAVGEGALVPVVLRIEQRTRVAGGKTKHFPVPVIDLRDVTAGALMAGQVQSLGQLGSGQPVVGQRQAITSGPAQPDQGEVQLPALDDIRGATSADTVRNIWRFLKSHDALTDELSGACADRVADLEGPQTASADTASATEGDPEVVWQQVLAAAGKQGMSTDDLLTDFEAKAGIAAGEAGAGEMRAYLEQLGGGEAA